MTREEAVAYVQREIATEAGLSGAELTKRLRQKWTDWSPTIFGCRTLRAFVTEHVPGVAEVGRSGLDPIYGVVSETKSEPSTADADLWRIWSSPSSPYALVVEIASGYISIIPLPDDAGSDKVKVLPPDDDEHRELARAFLELQFPGATSDLEPLISDNPFWWQQWMKEIKKRALSSTWGPFRFHRLLSLFATRLISLGVDSTAVDAAVIQLRSTVKLSAVPRAEVSRHSVNNVEELRRLAVATIESMSEAELRELKLPLGLVLDASKRSH